MGGTGLCRLYGERRTRRQQSGGPCGARGGFGLGDSSRGERFPSLRGGGQGGCVPGSETAAGRWPGAGRVLPPGDCPERGKRRVSSRHPGRREGEELRPERAPGHPAAQCVHGQRICGPILGFPGVLRGGSARNRQDRPSRRLCRHPGEHAHHVQGNVCAGILEDQGNGAARGPRRHVLRDPRSRQHDLVLAQEAVSGQAGREAAHLRDAQAQALGAAGQFHGPDPDAEPRVDEGGVDDVEPRLDARLPAGGAGPEREAHGFVPADRTGAGGQSPGGHHRDDAAGQRRRRRHRRLPARAGLPLRQRSPVDRSQRAQQPMGERHPLRGQVPGPGRPHPAAAHLHPGLHLRGGQHAVRQQLQGPGKGVCEVHRHRFFHRLLDRLRGDGQSRTGESRQRVHAQGPRRQAGRRPLLGLRLGRPFLQHFAPGPDRPRQRQCHLVRPPAAGPGLRGEAEGPVQ